METLNIPDAEHLSRLLDLIVIGNPLHGPFLDASLSGLRSEEKAALAAYVSFCVSHGIDHQYLAECYNTIVKDSFREQLYFQRHKRYRYSTYAEVASSVYLNDEYMKRYMYGLAVTTYLWPNHRAILRFFLSILPRGKKGRYLEIGPGHGVYFMNAMRGCDFDSYQGIDISPTSIALTRALLGSGQFGDFSKYELALQDITDVSISGVKYDAIVMGEVLEHVEDPLGLMRKLHGLCSPDTFVYVTTAINAPTVDHIYLFDSAESVFKLIEEAGFRVVTQETVPYFGTTLAESVEKKLPVNIALRVEPIM